MPGCDGWFDQGSGSCPSGQTKIIPGQYSCSGIPHCGYCPTGIDSCADNCCVDRQTCGQVYGNMRPTCSLDGTVFAEDHLCVADDCGAGGPTSFPQSECCRTPRRKTSSSKRRKLGKGGTAGVVIACIIIIAVLAYCRRRQKMRQNDDLTLLNAFVGNDSNP